jgi:hypothetical protein
MAKTVLDVIRPNVVLGHGQGPMDAVGWQDAIRLVRIYHRSVFDYFTPDVITAAAQPLPQGVCRSCLALQDGRVHGREMTVAKVLGTTAGKMLVGGGCSRCRAALSKVDTDRCPHCSVREGLAKMADSRQRLGEFTRIITKAGDACRTCREVALRVIDAKVHPRSRSRSTGGSTNAASRSSSASTSPPVVLLSHGPPSAHDPHRTCVLCRLVRENQPQDVVIASVSPETLVPHGAWIASISEAREYVHRRVWPVPGWLRSALR